MKNILYILVVILLFSCDSGDANDCFQQSGNIVEEEVFVESFDKILVNRNVELILKQDADFKVVIETGENLINDVEVNVVNNELQLSDSNDCNFVRDYASTKIYVTAPHVKKIRSSTQYDISSNGILNYSDLALVSEDFNATGSFTVGDFRLQINTQNLSVVGNNISSFYISGETENLNVSFYSGLGRFQGEGLVAQHVTVFHRSSNDIIVTPIQSLTGEIRGVGDLISLNRPGTVEVEQFYTGELIFN